MIKVATWMWRCEPGVAAWHIEWAAILHEPTLQFIDLTPDNPICKHLLITHNEQGIVEFLCVPMSDTCVEAYVRDPMRLSDRGMVMGFVEVVRQRGEAFKLPRQPIGFLA